MIEITYDKVVHTSDHFEKIQEYTEQLIKQGDAFMDDTDGETVGHLIWYSRGISWRTMLNFLSGQGATSSRDPIKEPRSYHRAEFG